MAARLRIIVLERDRDTNGFDYVLWADVPTARQPFFASADKKSAWKDALPADLTALQDGSVVEHTGHVAFPPGGNMAQTQAELQNRWTVFQNEINATNPWRFYGSTWDGTTWVVTNVA